MLRGRPDTEYGVPFRLDYWDCEGCGLVFADPVPGDLIPSFYETYSTHAVPSEARHEGFWRLMDLLTPSVDGRGAFETRAIPRDARVLDFGCGSGRFLQTLLDRGHSQLSGCDFDPKVAAAGMPGIRFYRGFEELGDAQFDIITLHHVIEHLEDVPGTLARLRTHLAPGGTIYIRTPNAQSVLRRMFGAAWRGWETPRHLNVLTVAAMQKAAGAAGGAVEALTTSNDMRVGMIVGSLSNALPSRLLRRLLMPVAYPALAWFLHLSLRLNPESGEEIVAVIS